MAATSLPPGLHDVLYLILSHLAPRTIGHSSDVTSFDELEMPDSISARRDLARLARAHRSFTQPTLAVMWRSLPSQKPLEHLLCAVGIAQWPRNSERRDGVSLEMCRTPASHRSGWKRYQEYASLVREIVIDPLSDAANIIAPWERPMWQDTFWGQLSSTVFPKPVLPRLERAAIRSRLMKTPVAVDTGVLRLLNPSIRALDIRVVVSQPSAPVLALDQLGMALASAFSSMQSLEMLSMDVPNLASILNIESLPRSHPRLRYLKLNDRASSGLSLRTLAALSNLEHLHIDLCRSTAPVTVPSRRVTLAKLRSLAVSCSEAAAINDLLAHVNAPFLQTFSVCWVVSDPSAEPLPQELSKNLCTLVAKCPSLTAFEWSSTAVHGGARQGASHFVRGRSSTSLAESFAPLLAHRAMRSFSVRFRGGGGSAIPFTPADLRAIAEAWPDLETFRLRDDADQGVGSSVPVVSLSSGCQGGRVDVESAFALVRSCPRLRVLHFARVELVVGDFGSDLAHCPPGLHPALRELRVDHVVCTGEQQPGGFGDEVRHRKGVAQLRYLMEKAFPSAVIQIGG